jgi:hypothetical protein
MKIARATCGRPDPAELSRGGRKGHTVIDRTYRLSETPGAIRYLEESQPRRNVVLTVSCRDNRADDVIRGNPDTVKA